MAVEKVQGISRLEQLCEEFSEEERVRELKQEKKRQKRKNRRKNKCVCEIPTPLQAAEEKEINQAKVNTNSCGFLLVLKNWISALVLHSSADCSILTSLLERLFGTSFLGTSSWWLLGLITAQISTAFL